MTQRKQMLQRKLALLQARRRYVYRPYAQQLAFHALGASTQERLFLAGNRCGKTLAGAFEMSCHLLGDYPEWWVGNRFTQPVQAWAASVTQEATRDILQRVYLGDAQQPGMLPRGRIRRTCLRRGVADAVDYCLIQHASGGVSTLGFKSYDQDRPKFQGTARHVIHLDEEPNIAIYEECLMRTATTGGHILLTMTPLLGLTPLVERFVQNQATTVGVVRATWDDTPYLSAQEKQRLAHSLRPHELQARQSGEPQLGQGRVYPIAAADIACERFAIPATWPRAFGLDFGWTNPTAAVWGALDPASGCCYLYDCYAQTETSPAEHVANLRLRGDIPGVCDPSGQAAGASDGQSLMELYAQHGLYLQQADNSVEAGLMHVLEAMRAGRLRVFGDLTPWWREFQLYRRGAGGKIHKQYDHLMDATRYLVVSGLVLAQPLAKRSQHRPLPHWVGV